MEKNGPKTEEAWEVSKMSETTTDSIHERMIQRGGIRAELRAANALAIKQWRVEFSYPLSVLYFIVMPFLWFLPMFLAGTAVAGSPTSSVFETYTGTTDWVTFIAIGSAFSGLTMSLFWGTGMAFRREQSVGTLETLMTTPMRRDTLVWGTMLHNVQHGGLGVILQLAFSVLFFGVTLNLWGILPALGIVALAVIGMQGIVFAMTCIVLLAKQGWMIIEVISEVFLILAPISYPIAVLPPILQFVSLGSPLTWSVDAFRSFLMYGLATPAVIQAIVALVIIDVIFIAVGSLMFRYTERYVRSKGALEQF
ncbi:ABC transporter permease [Candidatus Thorarchaeota archaeon]|nr:MAG: ABC transporter permease [Candidatus Thorarchaeota archaeon]